VWGRQGAGLGRCRLGGCCTGLVAVALGRIGLEVAMVIAIEMRVGGVLWMPLEGRSMRE
jgi:hypothetical protein